MREKMVVQAPIDQWEAIAAQSSVGRLAVQTDKTQPVTVTPLLIEGRPAVIVSVTYGGLESSEIKGYWLVAETDYDQVLPVTTAWHDEHAIAEGIRKRGDSRGLKVCWKGSEVICQSLLGIRPVLPKKAIALAEAVAEDDGLRREGGWRVLMADLVDARWPSGRGIHRDLR